MKDSEPAFPCNSPDGVESYSGMTLRDYFAGQALAGLMGYWAERINFITKPFVAEIAYEFADAVIAVKHKETECIKEQSETTDSETAADDYSKPYEEL